MQSAKEVNELIPILCTGKQFFDATKEVYHRKYVTSKDSLSFIDMKGCFNAWGGDILMTDEIISVMALRKSDLPKETIHVRRLTLHVL